MAENSASKRHKSNDINETIDRAVSLPDKIGTSSVIFSLDFAVREVRLIEVTEDLLKQLSGQQPLKIIGPVEVPSGGGASDAVITSLDKTFSIKKVETSNAVYLIGPSYNDKYTVQSASQDYYEVKCIPPRLDKIKELCPEYNGIEAEIDNHFDVSRLLSYNELRNQIQASDAEFTAALFKFAVVDLCGKMRLLSKVAIRESTRHLVFTIMEQNWKLQHIDEDLCVRHIPEMDPVLLNFSLKSLGEKRNTDGTEGVGGAYWALDQDKISRATAHIQFNRQSDPTAPWECEDFLSTWDSETPGAKAPEESLLLNGIAIKIETKRHKSCTNDGKTSTFSYQYLPVENLSLDIQVRLGQLFAVRPRFLEHELVPYFLDMVGGVGKPKSIAELLLSHTRVVDDFYIPK